VLVLGIQEAENMRSRKHEKHQTSKSTNQLPNEAETVGVNTEKQERNDPRISRRMNTVNQESMTRHRAQPNQSVAEAKTVNTGHQEAEA
jgi:hypothetical protein